DDVADKLRVVVTGSDASGRPKSIETAIPVSQYRSAIRYSFPLQGNWLAAGDAGIEGHHRFNAPSEFAVDFFKVDANGHDFHHDSARAENWYAYGQPVMAAADGEVVAIVADQTQDRAFLAHLPGESDEQRGARIGRTMEERLFGKNARFPFSLSGNL